MPDVAAGRALALVAALACFGAEAQTMYKWKDEKGVTHFSEHPPPDEKTQKKASKVEPKVIPPSGGGAYDPNAWKARDAEAKKQRVDRGRQEQAEAQDRAKRAEQCDRARVRIANLTNATRVFRDNPDGTRTYFEDKERAAEIARAREAAEEVCR
jgi:hypothetical protein